VSAEISSQATINTIALISVPLFLLGYIIYYPPKSLFDFMQTRHPHVLYQFIIPQDRRIVALTMDDCPSPYTTTMLESLKVHNSTATFFIIGDQISGYEDLLDRIISEGHEVGNHAWTDEKTILRPLNEIGRQIKAVEELLPENVNGMKYFRPGGGFYSSSMVERATGLGYRVVLGCIYPHDPQVWSARVNARHVLSMVRPGGIIIMHDRRGWSAQQLELVLKGLKEREWEVVSLGRLLEISEEVNGKKND
jgi:peptidoglycan/xylan/chitin deacetylase (PgdA/CDA1 family)